MNDEPERAPEGSPAANHRPSTNDSMLTGRFRVPRPASAEPDSPSGSAVSESSDSDKNTDAAPLGALPHTDTPPAPITSGRVTASPFDQPPQSKFSGGSSDFASPLASAPKKRHGLAKLGVIILALIILAAAGYAGYAYGHKQGVSSGKHSQAAAEATAALLKVPSSATMIAQCVDGEGTQYVLPSNIPQGPIYNVWQNKVIGVEYMLGQSKIAAMKTQNLSLMGQKYNHIDVMYEAEGHAGFTEPHYHVILSFIPYSEEQKIKCAGGSSSMDMSGAASSTTSTSSKSGSSMDSMNMH